MQSHCTLRYITQQSIAHYLETVRTVIPECYRDIFS